MPSAIQELLGKPAEELSDEELMELIKGNRPQVALPKAPPKAKKTSKRYADIEGLSLDDLDDIEELNLNDDNDENNNDDDENQ